MGVISDAIDALEDWCCDLFKDGIKSQFDGISDLQLIHLLRQQVREQRETLYQTF